MADTETRSPEEIEREIRATQRDMSDTVNRLEEQLTPRNLLNGLLDKADESGIDARYMLDAARRNPIALGMIAIGALWLVSDSDARLSTLKPNFGGRSRSGDDLGSGADFGSDNDDDYAHGYVRHMALIEHRPEEDFETYRRRRDHARANYLMIEPRHDEDESSFRKRLDEATERLRERRERATERAREFARGTYRGASSLAQGSAEGTRRAAAQARSFYYDNPLLGGLAAAFVGAIAGSAIPVTRTEEEQLGSLGARALDQAKDTARGVAEQARGKKDELLERAEQHMRESASGSGPGENDGSDEQATRTEQFGGGAAI